VAEAAVVSFGGSRKKWARRSPRPIGWNGFLFRNKFLFLAFAMVSLVGGGSLFCGCTSSKPIVPRVSLLGVSSVSGVPPSVSGVSRVPGVSMVPGTGAPMFDFTAAFPLAKTAFSLANTLRVKRRLLVGALSFVATRPLATTRRAPPPLILRPFATGLFWRGRVAVRFGGAGTTALLFHLFF
jgi:hypothetical protein